MGVPVPRVPATGSLTYEDSLIHAPANEAEVAIVPHHPSATTRTRAARGTTLESESPQGDAGETAMSSASPAVLTIEELADFLRVNHKTVRDAITRGEIPGVRRIGGTIRIYRAAMLDWFAAGQGRAANERRRR